MHPILPLVSSERITAVNEEFNLMWYPSKLSLERILFSVVTITSFAVPNSTLCMGSTYNYTKAGRRISSVYRTPHSCSLWALVFAFLLCSSFSFILLCSSCSLFISSYWPSWPIKTTVIPNEAVGKDFKHREHPFIAPCNHVQILLLLHKKAARIAFDPSGVVISIPFHSKINPRGSKYELMWPGIIPTKIIPTKIIFSRNSRG